MFAENANGVRDYGSILSLFVMFYIKTKALNLLTGLIGYEF